MCDPPGVVGVEPSVVLDLYMVVIPSNYSVVEDRGYAVCLERS